MYQVKLIEIIIKQDIEALQVIISDKKQPALKVAIATSMATAIKKGDFETIEKIIQRVIGKVPDVVISRNENTNINLQPTQAKVKAILAKIESEI